MTTFTPKASANGRGTAPATRPGGPLPTRQKRPGYVALGVVLIVGLAALGAYFYTKAGHKTPVIEVSQEVPAGHMIDRSDLTTVSVSGITALPASVINTVAGDYATTDLKPGMLLQSGMAVQGNPMPAGVSKVGAEVKPSDLPADGVSDGDKVTVWRLPDSGSEGTSQPVDLTPAGPVTVFDVSEGDDWNLTLEVPTDEGPAIVAASHAGVIGLVEVSQ